MTDPTAPIVLPAGEGEQVRTSAIKADRPELSLLELSVAPGAGADLHLHRRHSDAFYVLEGEVRFTVGEEVVDGVPGTFVLAPPNTPHGFLNESGAPARMLNLHTPGGFAQYLREMVALRAAGTELDTAFFESHDVYDLE